MKELIKKLWNVSWDMWDSRNGVVHRNKLTQKEQIIAKLEEDVKTMHAEGQTNRFLPRMERTFFRQAVGDIVKKTEYQKRTWLLIARRYLERDRQQVARNRSIIIMQEWLLPGSTGDNLKKLGPTSMLLKTTSNKNYLSSRAQNF